MTTFPQPDIVTGNRATCVNCRELIYEVIDPYSGVVDWGSTMFPDLESPAQDFGCDAHPDSSEEGCGSHIPPIGYRAVGTQTDGHIDPFEFYRRLSAS